MRDSLRRRFLMRHFGEGRPRSRNEPFRTPDMWPLVGIAIVLLIVMMVGQHRPHGDALVDMAYSKYARKMPWAVREDAMRISVTRDGRVYFGVMMVRADELPEQIGKSLRAGAEKRVYLVVDSRSQYGDLRVVLNAVSAARVENVSFLTN
jgi:biopolymer transport protein ExbD